MTIDLLELAQGTLGKLTDEVVFVGGATVAIWITDPGAPPARVTEDVDVIVEVASRHGYYEFENQWQRNALPHAAKVALPSGARIRAVPPAYLLATKLEAFVGRGEGDLLASQDFADIVALTDGREELVGEVRAAPRELREYVAAQLGSLIEGGRLLDGLHAQLRGDDASQRRAEEVVMVRVEALVAAGRD